MIALDNDDALKAFLDAKVEQYNRPAFIENDPVSIPHLFSGREDIEIMGFFAATLAWGQRKTIISKCHELVARMDGTPYLFIRDHQETDLKALLGFRHRTFNDTDLLYFVHFFREHYRLHGSLEAAFLHGDTFSEKLVNFRRYFFSLPDFPMRTIKHVSSPERKSTCKRIVMYLRWMVRNDDKGVDFGLWNSIHPSELVCPCDLHVERVARNLKLITRTQVDWQTALELTENLRKFDPADPVKYDFALFGLGIEEGFGK